MMKRKRHAGFSLLETLVAMVVFLAVGAIVMTGLVQLLRTQGTIANRTEMHTSVRSATELLQQEIGQAGRVSLPNVGGAIGGVTLTGPTIGGGAAPISQAVTVSSTTGMFQNILLDVDTGQNFEVVQATAAGGGSITAPFANNHAAGAPVIVSGSFGTGIVPPAAAPANFPNGSTPTVLKLYGDINRDGRILYVEYTCAPGTATQPGFLYRNEMNAFTTLLKPPVDPSMILLNNVLSNPNNTPCFTYQVQQANGQYFVTDVAVTMTVQTQQQDAQTHQYQSETKALLNISPRNVFYVWELYSTNQIPRNQPMPTEVVALLP
jgi:type II secretory pathway pseudopilin PulG